MPGFTPWPGAEDSKPDATLALPTAKIAVMGAEAAVNAVYAKKIAALESERERAEFVAARRAEYERDIDLVRLASTMVVDAVVLPGELREELIRRFALARGRTGISPAAGMALRRCREEGRMLTQEHRALQETVREFARDVVAPVIATHYEQHTFPSTSSSRWASWACSGCRSPRSTGAREPTSRVLHRGRGTGASGARSMAITLEAGVGLGAIPIFRYGTEEQKQRWLVPMCRGEILGAFGLTEPGAARTPAPPETTARPDDGEWVINGSKAFITNSGTPITASCTVTAVTGAGRGRPQGDLRHHRSVRDVRLRGGALATGRWDGTPPTRTSFRSTTAGSPRRTCSAKPGRGIPPVPPDARRRPDRRRRALDRAGPGMPGASRCVREGTPAFGRPIAEFQALQFKIADMKVAVDTARLATYRAAWLRDSGGRTRPRPALAKLYASEIAVTCAREAVQVHGAYGYMEEFPVARYYRDSKVLEIGEGTSEIQRMVIARELGV